MPVLRPLWALWGFGAVAMLAGCSAVPPQADPPTTQTTGDVTASSDVQALIETDWQAFVLPGKRATQYRFTTKDGRRAIEAHADSSASMLRRHLNMPADLLSEVSWSWWVDSPLADADLADIDRTDAPARLVFAFDGDKASLPPRARMMFELARVLTGEEPPFATLAYVWATQSPVGSVIKNPRSDRIRKIVVDSGKQQARRWREHRRSLVDDYQKAFGVAPGRLIGVAVMTDADNTRTQAKAWYGPISFHPPLAAASAASASAPSAPAQPAAPHRSPTPCSGDQAKGCSKPKS